MTQSVLLQPGAVALVGEWLNRKQARRVLLVTGQQSFESCGAAAAFAALLRCGRATRFWEFAQNPQLEDACRGLDQFRADGCDAIVAIGGGSALDMAKLIACFAVQTLVPVDCLHGAAVLIPRQHPLIAIPTTAGTGSEATHFAVVYHEGQKFSLAHDSLLPDAAFIDPQLTRGLPSRLTAITGLDALSQAVESFWSVNATAESQADAREAITLILEHLQTCVHRPTLASRTGMCWAAFLAGRAINVSKTTAAHALSYTMTSRFGIPHGHAVALTLGEMLLHNAEVDAATTCDPRGTAYVRRTMSELFGLFGCGTAWETYQLLKNFMRDLGLPTQLSEVGIAQPEEFNLIAESVNVQRLANNPRTLTRADLQSVLQRAA